MRAATLLVLLGACYGGGYDIRPQAVADECYSLDCPMMAGAEVRAFAVSESDTGDEVLRVRRATVSPPELAEVSLDGDAIVLHTASEPGVADGLGVLHVELTSGDVIDRDFVVHPRASLSIVADSTAVPLDLFPDRMLPGARLAMFAGTKFGVAAEYRDGSGQRLLGHDETTWTATNLQLAGGDDSDPTFDAALMRDVEGTEVGAGNIVFGTAMFPVDVISEHTTARIEAASASLVRSDGSLQIYAGESTAVTVLAYTEDGRYIYGGPPMLPLSFESSDPAVARVRTVSGRAFGVDGYRSGTATLTISFDGHTITLPVTVD